MGNEEYVRAGLSPPVQAVLRSSELGIKVQGSPLPYLTASIHRGHFGLGLACSDSDAMSLCRLEDPGSVILSPGFSLDRN
jgi:hypothetical protein